ncbi:integrase core domain protein [Ancylostoma duodenale]|uniref:Integrase core domain protein n=1 Tax=Ancylostoma duodenale TaxID=51022 RepID=A0A0C2H6W4_9BILA|nr:integrase core domain protein [Ancylostoma duodenale]
MDSRIQKKALAKGEDILESSDYILIDNILYKLPLRLYQDPQLVLLETSTIKNDIIALVHQSQVGTAHLGMKKTRAAVERIAICNNMTPPNPSRNVNCVRVGKTQAHTGYKNNITSRPWQRIHSDIIGPLPMTLDGNKFILIFIDSFSKYIVAEPLPDQKANTTAQTFITRFVARFGLPETLVTDQGSDYMSETFRCLLRNLHVNHRTSTPYHHESNGQVERANRTLQEQIAIATEQHQDGWGHVLHMIVHAYNCAESTSTKYLRTS